MHIAHRFAFIAILLLPLVVQAQVDIFRDDQPNFLHPRDGSRISQQDVVSVLYTDACGAPELIPDVAPIVRREGARIVVEIIIGPGTIGDACAAVARKNWVIPIGRLPKGGYEVVRRIYQPAAAGGERPLLSEMFNSIEVGDTPHASISGTWFDPSNPGSGFVIQLLPLDANEAEPRVMVLNASLDDELPVWLLGLGRFENSELRVDAKVGGNGNEQRQFFRYEGCGRLSYFDENFIAYDLEQLTTVAGVEPCQPPSGTVLLPRTLRASM